MTNTIKSYPHVLTARALAEVRPAQHRYAAYAQWLACVTSLAEVFEGDERFDIEQFVAVATGSPVTERPAPEVTVTAEFRRLPDGPVTSRPVSLIRTKDYDVRMVGGPTGYESFTPTAAAIQDMTTAGWLANFGLSGRYDECYVKAEEMARGLTGLGLMGLSLISEGVTE